MILLPLMNVPKKMQDAVYEQVRRMVHKCFTLALGFFLYGLVGKDDIAEINLFRARVWILRERQDIRGFVFSSPCPVQVLHERIVSEDYANFHGRIREIMKGGASGQNGFDGFEGSGNIRPLAENDVYIGLDIDRVFGG